MQTLLQISLEKDGTLTSFVDSTIPISEELRTRVFPLLKAFDPALRRRAPVYEGPNPDLAGALLAWRRTLAKTMDVPAYFIMHQKVLYAIADAAPQTEGELLNVPGFGAAMFHKFGIDILKITSST